MIEIHQVSYSIGGRLLLNEASFLIPAGARAGLIGPNGSGKTTLLRIIAGRLAADAGEVRIPRGTVLGYLAQHPEFPPGETVFRHVAEPPALLKELRARIEEVEGRMEGEGDPDRLDRLVESHRKLQAELAARGGREVEGRAEEVLLGLGVRPHLFQREARTLSGGEKNRVALARILCDDPELLVLDEPTNYLDIEMIEWLEDFLRASTRTVVASSHDRWFLNRVASHCLELREGKVHTYRGDYDAYALQREEEVTGLLKRYQKEKEEVARELEFIRRNFYGQRARQAQSRKKRVTRLEAGMVERPLVETAPPRFRFETTQRLGDDVLRLRGVDCGYGGKPVLSAVELELERGERVALLGPNGCGKTTLLHCIRGDRLPLRGEVRRGARTLPGYYDQECAAEGSPRRLFDEVHDLVPRWDDQEVRDLLAAFLFRGDRIHTPVASLSGGEKAKLAILRLILSGPNLLLLDEPTNHLDIHSRAALEEALLEFPGTIVFISHDRYFIERVADRILYIEEGTVRELMGGYPDYREVLRRRRQREAEARDREKERLRAAAAPSAGASTPKRKRVDEERLLEEITRLEAELAALQEEASRPEVLRSGERSRQLKQEMEALRQRISLLYRAWEGN